MKIEVINNWRGWWGNSVWSAISTRLARCEVTMTSVRIEWMIMDDLKSMKAFRTVLQFSPATSTSLETMNVDLSDMAMVEEFRNLLLFCPVRIPREPVNLLLNSRLEHRDIGNEGWEFLAKTVQLRPGFVDQVSCCHHVLQEAKKEDMRVIWEVVGDVELLHDLGNENFEKRNGEATWIRLVQVMDMSEDDIVRDIEKK